MQVVDKALELIRSPKARFVFLSNRGFYDRMEDRKYLELRYKMIAGKNLNLDDPRSFDDKLQWLKLYDHNPFYSSIVDKYEAKKYISERVGEDTFSSCSITLASSFISISGTSNHSLSTVSSGKKKSLSGITISVSSKSVVSSISL